MSQTRYASRLNRTAQFPLVFQGGGSEPWGLARWSTFDAGLKVTRGSGETCNRVPKKKWKHSRPWWNQHRRKRHSLSSYLRHVGSCHCSCDSSGVTPGFPKVSLERFRSPAPPALDHG